MLRRIALIVSVLCCALLITTAVVAAPRHQAADGRTQRSSASRSKTSGLTLQRLLSERLRLSLDMFLNLRGLDGSSASEPTSGTLTIVDEPDPFAVGNGPQPEPGEEPDETQERRQREQDEANSGAQPYETMH